MKVDGEAEWKVFAAHAAESTRVTDPVFFTTVSFGETVGM